MVPYVSMLSFLRFSRIIAKVDGGYYKVTTSHRLTAGLPLWSGNAVTTKKPKPTDVASFREFSDVLLHEAFAVENKHNNP